jgi:hypothetical protein
MEVGQYIACQWELVWRATSVPDGIPPVRGRLAFHLPLNNNPCMNTSGRSKATFASAGTDDWFPKKETNLC